MARRILVSGLCQAGPLASALRVIFPDRTVSAMEQPGSTDEDGVAKLLRQLHDSDLWVRYMDHAALTARPDVAAQVAGMPAVDVPMVHFRAYHPDITGCLSAATGMSVRPHAHSGIVLWCYRHGIPLVDVAALFTKQTFEALGYFDLWLSETAHLKRMFEHCDLDFQRFFLAVKRQGAFMYHTAHPRPEVMAQLARAVSLKMGAGFDVFDRPVEIDDVFAGMMNWPVYPEIGSYYAVPSSRSWTINHRTFDFQGYIDHAYGIYAAESRDPKGLTPPAHGHWTAEFDAIMSRQAGVCQ